jgi:hypothetical protein
MLLYTGERGSAQSWACTVLRGVHVKVNALLFFGLHCCVFLDFIVVKGVFWQEHCAQGYLGDTQHTGQDHEKGALVLQACAP